jgi:HK97 family phage prohead protease
VKIKNQPVKVKAGPDDGLAEGQFQAYASVFGNKDSYGDVVVKGAFADTLKEWDDSGSPIPLLFGHNMSDPDYNIGHVVKAVEDDHGLLVTAELDLENPKAVQTYRLLKGRRINQMSFAYDVIEGSDAKSDALGDYFELRKLKTYEVSVVPIGANQETEVLAVKAAIDALAGEKAGRVLAAKHIDSLRAAQEAIGAVITAAEGDQEKASDQSHGQVRRGARKGQVRRGAQLEVVRR